MAAPKGNKFWMLRSKHGRDKLFATPELLWEAACEYFQWCDENPWTTRKATQKTVPVKVVKDKEIVIENQQQTQQEVTPTSRPYSLMGMCVYLGASTNWWNEFRSACINKRDKDFFGGHRTRGGNHQDSTIRGGLCWSLQCEYHCSYPRAGR